MRSKSLLLLSIFFSLVLNAQQYSNPIAMHKDSSAFVAWAVSAEVVRGYVNISDTTVTYTDNVSGITSNRAFNGTDSNAVGRADGQVVSLGDGGYAVLQFDSPIINGEGPDFAVFENAILSPPNQDIISFVELAFVEVSSNGVDYVRFPAVSNASVSEQIGSFENVDWRMYENFAGVFPVFYGYPFDLEDLVDEPNVDVNNITHIRVVDVVGSIDPRFATYDSHGNPVNDPFPTPFHTGGFDLDAVGVIHSLNSVSQHMIVRADIFPNPVNDFVNFSAEGKFSIEIHNALGVNVFSVDGCSNVYSLDVSAFVQGVYFVSFVFDDCRIVKKMEVLR